MRRVKVSEIDIYSSISRIANNPSNASNLDSISNFGIHRKFKRIGLLNILYWNIIK